MTSDARRLDGMTLDRPASAPTRTPAVHWDVRIPMRDVRVMGRATQGVRLVNLKEKDDLVVGAQKVEAMADEVKLDV